MLEFNPLQLEDLPKLRDYFGYSGSRICDTTPGTVMMWRDMYKTEWAIYDGSLYFKVEYPGLGSTFTLPLGGGRREHYRQIADYCCRRGMPIAFYPVPKDELERLQEFFPNSAAISNRDAFRVITEEDVPAVKAFLDRYAAGRDKAAASFHEDLRKTHEVLDNYQLYDMAGGMLLVDGNIVGFSLGEIVGDTLFTHIEKADRDYQGCYQMVVAQFAQQFAHEGVHFINREDDAGDPGLRTSKLSYHPVALLEKYTVTVDEPCKFCDLAE